MQVLRHVWRILTIRRWHDWKWRYGFSHLYYKCVICGEWVVDVYYVNATPGIFPVTRVVFKAEHHEGVLVRRRLIRGRRGKYDVSIVKWVFRNIDL